MAQGWCAIAESDASIDVVGGHDVVKNKGETVSDVFVLWCQLLKWEKQFVLAPRGTPELATSAHADECARAFSLYSSQDPPASFYWRHF